MTNRQPVRLALLAGAGLAVLSTIPSSALPADTSATSIGQWWTATGPVAAVAIIRLIAMLACCYVAVVASLVVVADVLSWRWLRHAALLVAPPALRRPLAAGVLTVAIAAAPTAAVAQSGSADAPIAVTDIGTAPGPSDDPIAEPILLTDIGSLSVPDRSAVHPLSGTDSVGGFTTYAVDEQPDAWIVESGDHLWSIAVRTLAAADQPTDDDTVRGYWTRLIATNAALLDGDPDLIVPGQVLTLPVVTQG